MLKETKTEKTIDFLPHFYHWWHFNWGGGGAGYAHARGPGYFGNYHNIFLPNLSEDQTKSLTICARALGTVPYGKPGAGYCITFIKG